MSHRPTKRGFGSLALVVMIPLLLLAYHSPAAFEEGVAADALSSAVPAQQTAPDTTEATVQAVLPGFEVQELYAVPNDEEGSWVALAVGPDGNLIASDQSDEGLFRITVTGNIDAPDVEIEEFAMPVSGAQGLLWAFDHLYANVNGVGLFRLRNTGDTDQFNVLEYFEESPDGGGEHGNHGVIPTEDGEALYVINGNHTPHPAFDAQRVSGWEEDILLPRNWDARGHARGVMAPGGVIQRVSPDGSRWEAYSIGYRNAYDIAMNPEGELFAYDSDMEWDMGMPWYRPTRIMHSVSGSDFGWRSGSGKWKAYFEDSLPPVTDIGPGSPTGLLFGTGAQFPARYQRALYALDWTFGTIRAVHLAPDGSSYRAEEVEEFVAGTPLPLTDAVIGADGHLYFLTGGRGLDSHLYRVVYRGNESTAPAEPEVDPEAQEAREQRRALEAFHGTQDPEAIEAAWPHLASEDRFIRHAARVAIEFQPVDAWVERALNEDRPRARIAGMVALARNDAADYRAEATDALIDLDPAAMSADEQLSYLRAMALVFMRLGDPTDAQRAQITDALQELLPNEDSRVNVELIRTLVYLRDAQVIEKALTLMQQDTEPPVPDWDESLLARSERYGGTIQDMIENPPPTNKLEYAYMLRNLRNGWSIDQRREYFTFINEASDALGGASYTGFLERMRDEALTNASEEEIAAVSDLTGVNLGQQPDFEINPPEGPGREWTVDGAIEVLYGGDEPGWGEDESFVGEQSFERGRSLYHAVSCAACHRFGGYGGNIGPDLNTVARRFGADEMLEAIIHPSEIISDQYSSSEVRLDNGEVITGLVVERGENIEVYTRDPDAEPTVVDRDEVASIEPVDVSQMPAGLINPLNPDELRDLMAYLYSAGDPEADIYTEEDDEATTDEEDQQDE